MASSKGPGTFETTLTRPDLFGGYYTEQLRLLRKSHGVELEVGLSDATRFPFTSRLLSTTTSKATLSA
jgi:hypothetical protein